MLLVSDYNNLEKIDFQRNKLLYRAESSKDKQKVLLKIIESPNGNNAESTLLAEEYEISKKITFKGIAHIVKQETYHNHLVTVLEYFDGISLTEYIETHEVTIEQAIKISIEICEILEYLYQKGIVHQDLSPSHFLINPKSLEIRLIEFSLASQVSSLNRTVEHPNVLNGSLSYISPEQTGKIKSEIDNRSDLYSFGVILFELFSGKLPFDETDSLSLIHCHIAKNPVPPHFINPEVPAIISCIIMKLLSKDVKDRYQSPYGLKTDLQSCLIQWNTNKAIENFELGRYDFLGRLQVPKHFYGRESELDQMLKAFNKVNSGAKEMILIEGSSGIGKSALVHRFKEKIQFNNRVFAEGKFNQFQRNIPYLAFIQAFKEFTDYILTQSDEKIAEWKEKILRATGVNGKVLTTIIPHLESLIGIQPVIPELESEETQNRMHYVFANFIKCIARKDFPLILFFDDLQWADAASLNLLKIITLDKDIEAFLFIGSYRENEITLNTNFSLTVEEINRKGIEVQKILLTPLSYKNVEKLIYEALFHPVQNDEALIRLIYDKSEGNPFFINAFVKSLFIENIISFDYYSFKWEWNSEHINRLKFTENIIGLMTERIQKLSSHAQRLLKIAACIGFSFDISLLNIILNKNADEIKELLKPALDEGLCMIIGDTFRFLHDRIQQAAYSLIPESIKNDEHLKIGNTLLQSLTTNERNKYIFEIVNQLNAGSESIMSRQEKDILAALNLTVGIKARNSAAYKPSFEYLQTGIRLLDENAWKLHYDLALQLYTIGAESAFLSGNTDQMNEWIETVIQNASGVLDKVKVYEIMMKWYNSQHRLIDSVQTCLKILELLNVRFPKKPKKLHVLYAFLKTKIVLSRRRPEDLEHLRLIKDPYAEAAIRLLSSIGAAFFFARPDLFPLITTKNFLLMVRYGNSSYSSAVIAGLGLLTIAGEKNIEKGYRLGKVAVKVSEKFEANSFKYQCMMMVNNFIFHWKEHLENILEPLRLNYWHCLETGNTEFASYSAGLYSCNAFFCGKNLKELTKEMLRFNEDIRQLRQEIALNIQLILTQTVLNLQEPCDDPVLLTGKEHNEEEMMKLYKKTKAESLLFYVHFNKLILSYLFGKYDEAYINACEARNRLISVPGSSRVTIFYFYETLTLIAVCNKYTNKQNKVIKARIQKNLRTFRKFNHFAPMNCSHKLLLIEAEGNRVTGNTAKAGEQYDKAIEECKKNRYLNDLALIHELAGKFYESQGRNFIAKQYLIQAHKLFQEWGALAKVKDIEQNHPFLFEEIQMAVLNPQLTNDVKEQNSASNLNTTLQELDLHSILRASTAISSEIQLDKLIKKLVKIAVENTGAQNGYLILKKQNGFYIEAEGSIDKEEEEIIIQSIPLSGNPSVSEAIIQFVYVTQENLVLDNATDHPNFSSDPIILKNGSKSVLCTPIIHQGSVIGLLYFENRLINNAFTPDRIEIVKLLSGQMAISLQNALNEQKKMNAFIEQEKLLKQINHHQKELLDTKLEIQEQTYHNISEEIHDNIGQALSLIKININTIDLNNPELAKDKLSESKNLLTKVIQDLRDLSKLLNTDFIEKTGLSNAIDQQLQLLNKTGLYSASLHLKGVVSKFESNRELVIFRIVQELLNNVVKHANASMIKITMDYQVNKLVITVEDNGRGFDAQIQLIEENKGLGLRNIFNRISFIKGTIDIKSEPDRGTVVVIDLPK